MKLPLNPTRKDIENYKKYLANLPEDEWNIMYFKHIKVTLFMSFIIIALTGWLFYVTSHMIAIPIIGFTVICIPIILFEYFCVKNKIKKTNKDV